MSGCLTISDLQAIGKRAVDEYDSRIAGISNELCAPFNVEAMRLEDRLLNLYQLAVFCVREEQDLEKIASMWEFMVGMCDSFAERLSHLKNQHPDCGAGFHYDNILDIRNKCQRLQEMHL